jgi:hypothetical protein
MNSKKKYVIETLFGVMVMMILEGWVIVLVVKRLMEMYA